MSDPDANADSDANADTDANTDANSDADTIAGHDVHSAAAEYGCLVEGRE